MGTMATNAVEDFRCPFRRGERVEVNGIGTFQLLYDATSPEGSPFLGFLPAPFSFDFGKKRENSQMGKRGWPNAVHDFRYMCWAVQIPSGDFEDRDLKPDLLMHFPEAGFSWRLGGEWRVVPSRVVCDSRSTNQESFQRAVQWYRSDCTAPLCTATANANIWRIGAGNRQVVISMPWLPLRVTESRAFKGLCARQPTARRDTLREESTPEDVDSETEDEREGSASTAEYSSEDEREEAEAGRKDGAPREESPEDRGRAVPRPYVLIPAAKNGENYEVRRVMRTADGSMFLGKEDVKAFFWPVRGLRTDLSVKIAAKDVEGDEEEVNNTFNNRAGILFVEAKKVLDISKGTECKRPFPEWIVEYRSGAPVETAGDEPAAPKSGAAGGGGNAEARDLTTELQEAIEAKECERRELEKKLEGVKRDSEDLKERKSYAEDWQCTMKGLADASKKRRWDDIGSRKERMALENLKECLSLMNSSLDRTESAGPPKKRKRNS